MPTVAALLLCRSGFEKEAAAEMQQLTAAARSSTCAATASAIARILANIPFTLRVKQLFHDREEVTAWLRRSDRRSR